MVNFLVKTSISPNADQGSIGRPWGSAIFERMKTTALSFSTNTQSRFAPVVLDSVLGPLLLSAAHLTVSLFLSSSEATHEASQWPLKGAVSAPGSETEARELLGGTDEKSASLMRIHLFALQTNQ